LLVAEELPKFPAHDESAICQSFFAVLVVRKKYKVGGT
jgi:hypothetical protein